MLHAAQIRKVKSVPKRGSRIFSSSKPNTHAGTISRAHESRYLQYRGFSGQVLSSRTKFKTVVKTYTKEKPISSAYTPKNFGKNHIESTISTPEPAVNERTNPSFPIELRILFVSDDTDIKNIKKEGAVRYLPQSSLLNTIKPISSPHTKNAGINKEERSAVNFTDFSTEIVKFTGLI